MVETSRFSEWDVQGDIGILTINNPPQNYLKELEFVDLEDLEKWTKGSSLKGLILMGKGRHFCAGAVQDNIFQFHNEEAIQNTLRKGKAILDYIQNLPIPTVAAINGACLGGGLEVALACHIRVCSETSFLSFPETGLKVMPGLNGTLEAPKKAGLCNAIEMILTSKMINAQEALKMGFVDHVVPGKEVFSFSMNFLKRLTEDRPLYLIHAVMDAINDSRRMKTDDAIEKASKTFCKLAAEIVQKQKKCVIPKMILCKRRGICFILQLCHNFGVVVNLLIR